jgi:hypothetical protein
MGSQLPKHGTRYADEVARLEASLRLRLRGYVCDFRISIQDGSLVLYGRARTYYGKQLAQHGVMQQSRLPIRANHIEVF